MCGSKELIGSMIIGLGAVTMIISIAYFGVGLSTTLYVTNLNLGSPWAGGIALLATAFLALSFKHPCPIITGAIIAGIAAVLCFVGMIVDSIAFGVVSPLKGCMNTETGELYGNEKVAAQALRCLLEAEDIDIEDDFDAEDYDINNKTIKNFDANGECYCQHSEDTDVCFIYTLAKGGNCNDILNEYDSLLATCVAFGVITFILMLTLSCCSCAWCGSTSAAARVAIDTTPQPVAPVVSGARDPWAAAAIDTTPQPVAPVVSGARDPWAAEPATTTAAAVSTAPQYVEISTALYSTNEVHEPVATVTATNIVDKSVPY